MVEALTTLAVVGAILATATLVVVANWRVTLGALALEYLCAAGLLATAAEGSTALVKLLVGGLAIAILGLTAWQINGGVAPDHTLSPSLPTPVWLDPRQWRQTVLPTGLPFRVMAALMVNVCAFYLAQRPEAVLPELVGKPLINGVGYALMASGLLNLGLTEKPLPTGLGLLTFLIGFELLYAQIESALAVTALLAIVQLGIALTTSYLMQVQAPPVVTEPPPALDTAPPET